MTTEHILCHLLPHYIFYHITQLQHSVLVFPYHLSRPYCFFMNLTHSLLWKFKFPALVDYSLQAFKVNTDLCNAKILNLDNRYDKKNVERNSHRQVNTNIINIT